MKTLNPTLRYVGPHVTVCNYFNYSWTHFADHVSEEDATGTLQRIQVKNVPLVQQNSLALVRRGAAGGGRHRRPGPARGLR